MSVCYFVNGALSTGEPCSAGDILVNKHVPISSLETSVSAAATRAPTEPSTLCDGMVLKQSIFRVGFCVLCTVCCVLCALCTVCTVYAVCAVHSLYLSCSLAVTVTVVMRGYPERMFHHT